MGNHSRLYTAGNMVYRKTVHIKWLVPYPGRAAACTVLKSRQNAPVLRCFSECVSIPGKYQNAIQPAFRANIRAPRYFSTAAGKLSPAPVARKRGHNAPPGVSAAAGDILPVLPSTLPRRDVYGSIYAPITQQPCYVNPAGMPPPCPAARQQCPIYAENE